ncbi:MAG: O-antigen ligase family protein [bacterium]
MATLISKKQLLIFCSLLAVGLACLIAYLPPVFILAMLTAIFLLVLAVKKIEYGIIWLAVYTPFEPFLLKFAPAEIYALARYAPEIFLLALAGILLVKLLIKNNWQLVKTPIDKPLVIFLILTALSMLINLESPYLWLLGLRQILRYVILFYLVIYLKPDKSFAKKLLAMMFIIVALQAVIGLGQAIIGQSADEFLIPTRPAVIGQFDVPDRVDQFWESGQRVFATLGRYDKLGVFLCFFLLLAFAFFYRQKKSIWPWFLIIFCLPTFILTYSRMSWLGLLLGIIIIGVFIKRDKKIIFSLIIFFLILAGYLTTYVVANNLNLKRVEDKPQMALAERLLELGSADAWRWGYRAYGRQYFIVHTITDVVRSYPVFGVGLGRYGSGVASALKNTEIYDELGLPFGVLAKDGQIDNNWFSLWGETGTLGVLAWAGVLFWLYVYCFRVYRKTNDDFVKTLTLGYLGAMPVVAGQAFLGPYFEVRTISLYFWLFGGLIVSFGQSAGWRRIDLTKKGF